MVSNGAAEEAIVFYKKMPNLGGVIVEISLSTFSSSSSLLKKQ